MPLFFKNIIETSYNPKQEGVKGARAGMSEEDLARVLLLTGTAEKIRTAKYRSDSIGEALHLARKKQEDAGDINGPYTIHLLLHTEEHFSALIMRVHPKKMKITYSYFDSGWYFDHDYHRRRIERAIRYQGRASCRFLHENPNFFSEESVIAFPDKKWKISGELVNDPQEESYSCGYLALHYLFQKDPEMIRGNAFAQGYAAASKKTHAIAKEWSDLSFEDGLWELFKEGQLKLFPLFFPEQYREILERAEIVEKKQVTADVEYTSEVFLGF